MTRVGELSAKKKVQCTKCDRVLNRGSLNTHMRLHDNAEAGRQGRFQCGTCSGWYSHRSVFIKHRCAAGGMSWPGATGQVARPESWYQARFDERNSAALNLTRSQKDNRALALRRARKREAARRAEEALETEEEDDFSVVISAVLDNNFDDRGDAPPSGSAGSPIAV